MDKNTLILLTGIRHLDALQRLASSLYLMSIRVGCIAILVFCCSECQVIIKERNFSISARASSKPPT